MLQYLLNLNNFNETPPEICLLRLRVRLRGALAYSDYESRYEVL